MGYKKTAIKGMSWVGGVRVVTRILVFVKTLIIARVLSPVEFGIFGIAILILTFVEIMTETGINIFLVQQKDDIDKYINTAWIVSIGRGILLACAILLTSSLVASFFNTPSAYKTIMLISIIPLIRGVINPAIVKLQKELLFQKEFYYRTIILVFETAATIIFVLATHSVNGLVYGMFVSVAVEASLSYVFVRPLPTLQFDSTHFKNIISHGKWVTGSTILTYFYQNGDNIAVGRLLGAGPLGLYDMAYRISMIPLTDFADVMGKVMFPVYVKISDDPLRLRKAYLKTLFILSLIVLPIGIILSFFAKEIVAVVLGAKWLGVVPALQVLGIFGAIRAISVFATSSLFLSLQKQHITTLVGFVGFLGLAITIVPFTMHWGIVGAGLSAFVGTLMTLPVAFYYTQKHLGVKSKKVD